MFVRVPEYLRLSKRLERRWRVESDEMALRKSGKSRVMKKIYIQEEMVWRFCGILKEGCISAAKLKGIGKIPRFILFAWATYNLKCLMTFTWFTYEIHIYFTVEFSKAIAYRIAERYWTGIYFLLFVGKISKLDEISDSWSENLWAWITTQQFYCDSYNVSENGPI